MKITITLDVDSEYVDEDDDSGVTSEGQDILHNILPDNGFEIVKGPIVYSID